MVKLQNTNTPLPTHPDEISYEAMKAWQEANQIEFVRLVTGQEHPADFCASYCILCKELVNEVAALAGASEQDVAIGDVLLSVPEIGEMPTSMFVEAVNHTDEIEQLSVYVPVNKQMPYYKVKNLLNFFLHSLRKYKRSLRLGHLQSQHLRRSKQAMSDYLICSDGITKLHPLHRPSLN